MIRRVIVAGFGALAFGIAWVSPAAAQFPPQGAVADPNNPSIATRTIVSPLEAYSIVTKYYYDCTKKKWVLVSFEWRAKGTSVFSGEGSAPVPTPKGGENYRPASTLNSGPPPSFKGEIGDPNRAFNPTTGQNVVRRKDNWIDVKTGQVIVAPKLCPETATQTTTPSVGMRTVPTGGGTSTFGALTGGHPVLVLGGNIGGGWSRNTYSDFPTFDGSGAGGGVYGAARFYVQPNFFVGPEAGFMILDINARNPDSAFGIVRTDAYLGGQAGVTLQGPGASKINIYTGLDADWSRITVGVSSADERMSKVLGGWSVHGGVEVQPNPSIPTMWLGLDLRHSDVSGTIGGDPTHVRWNMLSLTLSTQF
jgi:hypothetical protein